MERADAALYRAKRAGRDRVALAGQPAGRGAALTPDATGVSPAQSTSLRLA